MDATLYRADGTKVDIQPANGKDFNLQEIRAFLGCRTIEVIDTGDPSMVIIGDEEARCFDDFIINAEGTRIFREGQGITDPREHFKKACEGMGDNVIFIGDPDEEPYTIVGDIIYCPSVMFQ